MQYRRSRSQSLKKIHVGGGGGGGIGAGSLSSNGSQGMKSANTSALPTKLIQAQDRELLEDHDYDNNCYLPGNRDRDRDPFDNNNSKNKSNGNTGERKEKQRNSKLREEGGGGGGSFTDRMDNNLFSAVQDSSLVKIPEKRERDGERGKGIERRGECKGDDECNFAGMKDDTNSNEESESNPHQRTPALPPVQHHHWYFTQLSTMFDGPRVRKI